jgi:hypothetical protein
MFEQSMAMGLSTSLLSPRDQKFAQRMYAEIAQRGTASSPSRRSAERSPAPRRTPSTAATRFGSPSLEKIA